MKKAQMSLEMVIGLLILLVVAAVVIRIFLTQIQGIDETKKFKESLKYKEFTNKCEGYCNEFLTAGNLAVGVQFCISRLFPEGSTGIGKKGVVDAIGIEDDIIPISEALPVCEDAIYCFHTYKCQGDVGKPLEWSDCNQILCRYYYDTFKDYSLADAKVKEIMPNVGSCSKSIPDNENWWKLYFGNNPCSSEGTALTFSCSVSGSNVNCNWSGCPANEDVFVLIPVNANTILYCPDINNMPSGSCTISNVPSGTYTVTIGCGDLTSQTGVSV